MILFPHFIGAAPRLRAAIITVALASALALPAAPSRAADTGAWTLDQLMTTLAQRKSGRATFTETKYLAIAEQPIESSGELLFIAPDHLEKHTLRPKPERLVVDGGTVSITRNDRQRTISLESYPELGAFIESIRATLSGNRDALERVYQVAVAGSGDDWSLVLTPLDSRMRRVISRITLGGTGGDLLTVEIRQPGGDHSQMRIRPVDTH